MTAYVLVSGTIFRAPEQRTSKAGKPFVAATIRAKDGEATQWCSPFQRPFKPNLRDSRMATRLPTKVPQGRALFQGRRRTKNLGVDHRG
jgi:hypothetical protein